MKFIVRHKKFVWTTLITAVVTINTVGYLGAYALTNYRRENEIGLGYPRPENGKTPADIGLPYKSDRIIISDREWIETWSIQLNY